MEHFLCSECWINSIQRWHWLLRLFIRTSSVEIGFYKANNLLNAVPGIYCNSCLWREFYIFYEGAERDCRTHGWNAWDSQVSLHVAKGIKSNPRYQNCVLWKCTFSGDLKIDFKEVVKLQRIDNMYFNIYSASFTWQNVQKGYREEIPNLLGRKQDEWERWSKNKSHNSRIGAMAQCMLLAQQAQGSRVGRSSNTCVFTHQRAVCLVYVYVCF